MAKKVKTKQPTTPDGEPIFYIVNPKGVVHDVPQSIAVQRLAQAGYRLAEKEEIAKLKAADGLQTLGKPAGKPHIFNPAEALILQQLDDETEGDEEDEETPAE